MFPTSPTMVDHVMRGPIMVMDSLPFGGDNDGTLPTEPEHWLESAPMQELLQKEGVVAKLAHELRLLLLHNSVVWACINWTSA